VAPACPLGWQKLNPMHCRQVAECFKLRALIVHAKHKSKPIERRVEGVERINKTVASIIMVMIASLSFVAIVKAQSVKVGVITGDRFIWSVETVGDYQLFATVFGRDYDKINRIVLDVTSVANPVINYTVTISYDNGTQRVEQSSENVETGKFEDVLRGFFFPAGLRSGDTFQIDTNDFQIDKTMIETFFGVDRQINYFHAIDLYDNGVGIYVNNNPAYLFLNFENSFDKYTGVLTKSSEFWEAREESGSTYNVTLIYALVESTAFNSGELGNAHLFSFSASTGSGSFQVNASSNSDLSGFSYSDFSKEIKLTAEGQPGTIGYTYLFIPKALISYDSKVKVYLDGSQIDCVIEQENDYDILFFRYQHSSHSIMVNLAEGYMVGGWLFYVLVAVIAVTLISCGLVVALKRLRKKRGAEPDFGKVEETHLL
jgi:hypothetical protein